MAKKIELLHTTYDESGNIESQEVVHPLTSPNCIIMENGKTLDEVMGDGIATPTLTHEGTSFKVGVGDSNIEVVDGDVAGMTLKGQSYQNILPKPTTLIMETDEKEFKINDKIDSNIIIDDNIAEIATVKGKTIVNAVQEESASEYTVLGEDLSGQSIVTSGKVDGNIKGVTLQGQTLVNTIQEPCKDDYVVLGADDSIEVSAETSGHGTIEDTVQGGINGAVLEGQTLVNLHPDSFGVAPSGNGIFYINKKIDISLIKPNTKYFIRLYNTHEKINKVYFKPCDKDVIYFENINNKYTIHTTKSDLSGYTDIDYIHFYANSSDNLTIDDVINTKIVFCEYQEGMENWDIPYFEGMQSVKMPVLKTAGKNLLWNLNPNNPDNNFSSSGNGTTPILYSEEEQAFYTNQHRLISLTIKPNTKYTFSATSKKRSEGTSSYIWLLQSPCVLGIGEKTDNWERFSATFTTNSTGNVSLFIYDSIYFKDIQLEESPIVTSYEPYQSNILTVNEEVTLRAIGDVKDELDLQTGRLTQRVKKVVLNGSEDWMRSVDFPQLTNTIHFQIQSDTVGIEFDSPLISDKFINRTIWASDMEGINCATNGNLAISINRNKLSGLEVADFKKWLSQNNVTVVGKSTESIKTIDLAVTDQDGNTIPHIQTQPTVTHITASSDYLIPTVTINNNLACDTIIKPSTLYTVRFKHDTVNTDNPLTVDLGGTVQTVTSTEFTITTPSELTHNQLVFSGKNNVVSEVQVIEGDVTNIEYPFFEGMSDVKFSDSKFINRGKNLFGICEFEKGIIGGFPSTNVTITNNSISLGEIGASVTVKLKGKPNTEYTISFTVNNTSTMTLREWNDRTQMTNVNGEVIWRYGSYNSNTNSGLYKLENIQIEEGSTATPYEPYKGVEVQQDVDSIPLTSDMFEPGYYDYNNIIKGMSLQQLTKQDSNIRLRSKSLIPVKPNTTYQLSDTSIYIWALSFDKNGGFLGGRIGTTSDATVSNFTTDANTHYIAPVIFNVVNGDEKAVPDLSSLNLTLQEVPQEIVLRGIGDVKDELDLTRGEYIQRIGVIKFNECPYEFSQELIPNSCAAVLYPNPAKQKISSYNLKCDKLPTVGGIVGDVAIYENPGNIVIFDKTISSKQEFIQKYNDCTIQYVLETPIIHKVNLTNTKVIQSYATETHYETITPSDSLIPNITIPSTLNYDVAIKPSTEYTIRVNTSDNLTVDLGGATGTLSNGKVTLTAPATLTHNEVKFSGTGKVKELMVVEGSEIKDNVPFFNGMKNVQMGGIKLVNIARYKSHANGVSVDANKTVFTYTNVSTTASWGNIQFDKSLLKTNTVYTIYLNVVTNNSDRSDAIKISLGNDNDEWIDIPNTFTGIFKTTFKTNDIKDQFFGIYFRNPSTSGQQIVIQNPMIIEGDWTHLDEIPFVESEMIIEQPIIRSQGKNLFDKNKAINGRWVSNTNGSIVDSPDNFIYMMDVKPNTTYTASFNGTLVNATHWAEYSGVPSSSTFIRFIQASSITTSSTTKKVIALYSCLPEYINKNKDNFQIEESSSATTYEPFKHQTLYSNRVIGYEDGCYYTWDTGTKASSDTIASVISDVEGLNVAYVTHASSNFSFYDKDGVYLSGSMFLSTTTDFDRFGFITIPANAKYMKMACGNANSTAAKDYHLKATVTGELPLRSLPNGICDTLNLVTGEYVQRVGEIVLNGSEDWVLSAHENSTLFYTPLNNLVRKVDYLNSMNCDKLVVHIDSEVLYTPALPNGISGYSDWREQYPNENWIYIKYADSEGYVEKLKQWLSQNPITVQYELATPIVRKLGFTTKGNYREQVLDGREEWIWNQEGTLKTTERFSLATITDRVCGVDNLWCNTIETINTYNFDAEGLIGSSASSTIYLRIKKDKCDSSWDGFVKWLSQNPTKISYLTNQQSSESYSNIHKPIFFNNVDVQFLPQNLDIQPQLTLQARTKNSYVVDMMKANTKYSVKLLSFSGGMLIDGTHYALANNRTFVSPSTLTNKELIITGQWHEPMIIEGDVTGKNLPYFKGILSSYHDVDEIEVYSVNKNLFDIHDVQIVPSKWETTIDTEKCKITSKRVVEDNTGAFATRIVINNIKPSTRYCLRWASDNGGMIYVYTTKLWDSANQLTATHGSDGKAIFCTPANTNKIVIGLNYGDTNGLSGKDYRTLSDIALYEIGVNDEITEKPPYIPHAHNTTLIEMPTRLETVKVVRPKMKNVGISTSTGAEVESTTTVTSDFVPVQPKEFIHVRNGASDRTAHILCYDVNKNFVCYLHGSTQVNAYLPENCYFVRINIGKSNCSDLTITRQAHKPIQLNSLPNGVYDEIIMKPNSNKVQLVQRVGKVVLDGCDYTFGAPAEEVKGNDVMCKYIPYTDGKNGGLCISDRFLTPTYSNEYTNIETIMFGTNTIIMSIRRARTNSTSIEEYLKDNPITVYYELETPIIHEIQLKGYPHVYENGTVTLNTDIPHQTLISYNVNQEQLINTQNETIIRHDQQIDDLYYYIEMYLEEIYQMELFRMKLELSL